MPELAEVEILMRYLKKNIMNEEIISYKQNRNNLRYPLSSGLKNDSENSKIINITRRAKFLNIELDNNNSIIFHLGMSGRLTVKLNDYAEEKHDHILISFASGSKLIFNDARRFGMVYSCPSAEFDKQDFLKNMGIEPLIDEFDATYLKSKINNKKAPIKTTIMDSKIVVGVGNIYAAESLFEAKINPEKLASSLTDEENSRLVIAIKSVLSRAIKAGGTTLKDFVNGDNKPGYFKQELNVYDRVNKPCYICKEPIRKIKQAGRSSFFCANCQS
jgi:formamidopyrimidine-DNA glycosylase